MLSSPPNSSTDVGESQSTESLFPAVYEELRKLAAKRVDGESITATALVHEAFIRLNGGLEDPRFQNTRHLYAAAGEAMRWILIDRARWRNRCKRWGGQSRVEWSDSCIMAPMSDAHLLAVDDALKRLEVEEPESAELVKLRFFSGFSLQEIAKAHGTSYRTIKRRWSYAKAWLKVELDKAES